ncbi:hypothetical protein CDD83_3499 [Cordyceps sp. RAO-2017]|nr:hypothetical protein CDD83_3499 [Cordyceps sp. RAO-2017]
MWRDRTNLYISYRQSGSRGDEDRRGLLTGSSLAHDGDIVLEMDLLPPRWAEISDDITDLLAEISSRGQRLERLHQQHVLPGFNDSEAKQAEEVQIEKLTQEITKGFHDCHRLIQRIEQTLHDSKQLVSLSRAEETIARNLQISLASRVQEASASFRKKQSAYLKKLRDMGSLASFSAEPPSTPQTEYLHISLQESLYESDADRVFSQSTLQAASQQKMLHFDNSAIAQREREIGDIALGIIELSDLFSDLQTMVIDQGTMLDRIDYNVERMNEDVKRANKELKVAFGYQRKTARRKIIFLLLLIIAGLFILLFIKPKKHGS